MNLLFICLQLSLGKSSTSAGSRTNFTLRFKFAAERGVSLKSVSNHRREGNDEKVFMHIGSIVVRMCP
jgi:hypothetical protein